MKRPVTFVIKADIMDEIKEIARIEKRSQNQQVEYFLENSVMVWNLKQDKIREYALDYEDKEGRNED